jgi:hypothetical protein
MAREFETTEESLKQLCADVLHSFPESEADLYVTQQGGDMLSRHGSTAEMMDILRNYCGQFPKGLLRYQPDHAYGMVIMLWCHCTLKTGCVIKCPSDGARPRAFLVISDTTAGNKKDPTSQAEISALAQQAMMLQNPEAD